MRGRSGWAACGCLMLLLLLVSGCGGDDAPAALPTKGAEVCAKLREAERFRYTLNYVIESPQQENPPDDSTGGDYAVKPSHDGFKLAVQHDGAAVRPDRLDFVNSLPDQPDQPATRTIRIGQNQWLFLVDAWQVAPDPTGVAFPFTPPNICDVAVSPLDLSGRTADAEMVGETRARHIRIDDASLSAASQLFGPASDMGRLLTSYGVDLWVSEKDNRPVKIEAVSRASYPYGREIAVTIQMEIGSYNDGDIKIEPPPIQG